MPVKLKNLIINRVDLVDKGSNPDSHVVLFKREKGGDPGIQKGGGDITKQKDHKGGQIMTFEELMKSLEDSQVELIQKRIDELQTEVEEAKEALEKAKAPEEKPVEIPEEFQKQFTDLEARMKAAEAVAKQERDKRLDAEFAKRAEGFQLVGEKEGIAKILRQAYDVNDEYGQLVEKALEQAKERISKGELFKEQGSNESDSGKSPYDALVAKAKEITNADANITFEKAFDMAIQQNQELYAEYIKLEG